MHYWIIILLLFEFTGLMMHQNVSTPLEPCRVAPYVNVPRLPQLQFNSSAAAAAAFSAFDPAILTAAQQVIVSLLYIDHT